MNNVERFKKVMAFEAADRLPVIEWAGWWDKTKLRWYGEGLPGELKEDGAIREYCGLDCYSQLWVYPYCASCPEPTFHGAGLIKNMEEYRNLMPHLYPQNSLDKQTLELWAEKQNQGDMVVWITLEGFFWHPRTLLGIENHMYALYDQPDLIHKINENILQYNLLMLNSVCEICTPTFMTFAEDMSYNKGPMLSKNNFDEFLKPYYCQIIPELKKRNIISIVDSDGDVTELIPWLKEVGIEGILPLERQAGVDVAVIRKNHPEFLMIGAFDKMVMSRGKEAIIGEFERLQPVMKQGGFIPSVDHQTPPDVSFDSYCCYVSLLKEYCQKYMISNTTAILGPPVCSNTQKHDLIY